MFDIKNFNFADFKQRALAMIQSISSEGLGWLAIIILHAATVPSFFALMSGLSDALLPLDMILMIWTGLGVLFLKAAIQRDLLNLITIGIGFMAQATLMALTFFK